MQLNEKIPGSDDTEDAAYIKTHLEEIINLSVTHVRGAQSIRSTVELEKHRLDMFLPTIEDWHAKLCFLDVITFIIILYT